MAGCVIISKDNAWSVGSRIFHPLMELLKNEYIAAGIPKDDIETQFSPLDEGFEHISLEDTMSYVRFLSICRKLRIKLGSNSTLFAQQNVLVEGLESLWSQLKADTRYVTED